MEKSRSWGKIPAILFLAVMLLFGAACPAAASGLPIQAVTAQPVSSGSRGAVSQRKVLTESGTFGGGDASDAAVSRRWMRSISQFERCYGDQLTGETRSVYDAMVKAWAGGGIGNITFDCADVSFSDTVPAGMTIDGWWAQRDRSDKYLQATAGITQSVQTAYDAFAYDYPEVFWIRVVSYSLPISFDMTSGSSTISGTIREVVIQGNERYYGAKSEVAAFSQAVDGAAAQIRASISGTDRYQTVMAIHDYICRVSTYDYMEMNCSPYMDTAHTAAGVFLKDGIVVCEGYAKAVKILCQKFGIECVLVVGDAGGPHMWNYIKMDDGRWYLLDATWDDQIGSYAYFLIGSTTGVPGGGTVADERVIYTDFSGSNYKSFVMPTLNAAAYERSCAHNWQELSRTAGTCKSYATVTYQCTVCGVKKSEFLQEGSHSWGTYKSDKNATALKDGTKTASCIYCGKKNTVTDKGSKLKATIKVNASTIYLRVGQSTSALKVSGLAKGDGIKSWRSSRPTYVYVNSKGQLFAGRRVGGAIITITLNSGLKKYIKVFVQRGEVKATAITGLPRGLVLRKGAWKRLAPVLSPITCVQKVTYASSNKKVAAVSANGLVLARAAGTARITVKAGTKKFVVTVYVTRK